MTDCKQMDLVDVYQPGIFCLAGEYFSFLSGILTNPVDGPAKTDMKISRKRQIYGILKEMFWYSHLSSVGASRPL